MQPLRYVPGQGGRALNIYRTTVCTIPTLKSLRWFLHLGLGARQAPAFKMQPSVSLRAPPSNQGLHVPCQRGAAGVHPSPHTPGIPQLQVNPKCDQPNIVNLSLPLGKSINDAIGQDLCSIAHTYIANSVSFIQALSPDCFLVSSKAGSEGGLQGSANPPPGLSVTTNAMGRGHLLGRCTTLQQAPNSLNQGVTTRTDPQLPITNQVLRCLKLMWLSPPSHPDSSGLLSV